MPRLSLRLRRDGTAPAASPPCSNTTDLLAWTSVTRDSAWLTHVLVSTTTVWVIDWVHSNTSDNWPSLPLSAVLVSNVTGLKKWLLKTTTTRNNTEACTAGAGNDDLAAAWELDTCVTVIGVGDDTAGVAGATAVTTAIAWVMFDVADFSTFWDLAEWEDVADMEGGIWAAGDNLACVDSFWSDHEGTFETTIF